MALPPAFRSSIGERCYLTYGEDGCVKLMAEETFRQEADELIEAAKRGEVSRARRRAFSSSVVQASLDKQGRIAIDQRLRDHAGLEPSAPVVLLGDLDHIELWEPSRYEAQETIGLGELAGSTGMAS